MYRCIWDILGLAARLAVGPPLVAISQCQRVDEGAGLGEGAELAVPQPVAPAGPALFRIDPSGSSRDVVGLAARLAVGLPPVFALQSQRTGEGAGLGEGPPARPLASGSDLRFGAHERPPVMTWGTKEP